MAISLALNLKLACVVVVVCMAVGGPSRPVEAMKCGQFSDTFAGCLYYGRGLVDRMPCCRSITAINDADTTLEARQDSCRCMVGILNIAVVNPNFPFIPGSTAGIFPWCRGFLPYEISPTADCDSINNITTGSAI